MRNKNFGIIFCFIFLLMIGFGAHAQDVKKPKPNTKTKTSKTTKTVVKKETKKAELADDAAPPPQVKGSYEVKDDGSAPVLVPIKKPEPTKKK